MLKANFQIAGKSETEIFMYQEDDCRPEAITASCINSAFLQPSNPSHDGFLRQLICAMYELQTDAEAGYDKLVKGLTAKTLQSIRTLDSGFSPEVFDEIRADFLSQIEHDQENKRSQKPEAATLREQGETFTLQSV